MKSWPVKNSYSKNIPEQGSAGSFWEDRRDRHHCGVDIYAKKGSEVVSIEDGIVVAVGISTSDEILPYWNKTFYIVIKNNSGFYCKYAELDDVIVKKGSLIKSGQLIGHVGLVLNSDKINEKSPEYIQKLKNKNPSMLHFELYSEKPIITHKNYLGGNWFNFNKPDNLLDPTAYLQSIKKHD